jgi:hypothetical protein
MLSQIASLQSVLCSTNHACYFLTFTRGSILNPIELVTDNSNLESV